VVLCVKPDVAKATARLAGACGTMRLLSVVAGLSTARLEAVMPGPVAVIRSMPDAPVTVRRGASAIAGGAHVTAADLDWAETVLGRRGRCALESRSASTPVTGLSGPMPAYLFMIVEALIEAGVHQGLPR
jgi:pyrroline-5-carboxylate reductase